MMFGFTSAWFYFIVLPLLVLFARFLSHNVRFYKKIIAEEDRGRYESLDGLRGFLAINVFFQHAATSYFYFQSGIWEIVNVRFYRHLGGEAVILFFMITSFLYWSKAISQKGEVDAGSLYRSRFLRLAPMYFFSAALIVFSIFIQSGLNIDIKETGKDILSWLTAGLVTTTTTNHLSVLPINAGIHWTLHFEWFFYLLLPVLATILKSKEMKIMALPFAFFALSSEYRGYWAIFMFGIIAAHIFERYPKAPFFQKPLAGLVPLAGVAIVYLMSYKPYSFGQYIISLAVFLSFVYGNDLFGLLKTQVAKFLGTISYSIYLLHGIVLFGVLNSVDYFYPITKVNPFIFWALILIAGLMTIILSAFTYRLVEYPFIRMIKRHKKAQADKTAIIDQVV